MKIIQVIDFKIIKKIAVFALSTNLGFVAPVQAKFDGYYIGASLGHIQQNTHINAEQNPGNANADTFNSTTIQTLPCAELFFGWGQIFRKKLYFGLEGKFDFTKSGIKKAAEDISFIYLSGRKGVGATLLFRCGYFSSSRTMLYGGIGIKTIYFHHNLFEKADKISAPLSKRSLRPLIEIGVETSLPAFDNLSFRISYSFMAKSKMITKTASFPTNHMYRENGSFNTGIAEHTGKASIVYHF